MATRPAKVETAGWSRNRDVEGFAGELVRAAAAAARLANPFGKMDRAAIRLVKMVSFGKRW
jgi:hypothetical protein